MDFINAKPGPYGVIVSKGAPDEELIHYSDEGVPPLDLFFEPKHGSIVEGEIQASYTERIKKSAPVRTHTTSSKKRKTPPSSEPAQSKRSKTVRSVIEREMEPNAVENAAQEVDWEDEQKASRRAEEEIKKKVEEEVKKRVEEELKKRAEEEAKQRAAEKAREKAEAEIKKRVEEEVKKRIKEEVKKRVEAEVKKKAEGKTMQEIEGMSEDQAKEKIAWRKSK
ncbi:hypothetical protein M7I_4620 [Glarea lozoyensis 74030]|nr:hypothetical protein M7I_4620 [Glarea lozoyensis 74030]